MTNGISQLEDRDWLFKQKVQTTGHFTREPYRYVLDEYFAQIPALNADIGIAVNPNFEVLGTNMTSALVTYPATTGGIALTTAGADNDQGILLPHLDTKQTAWTGTKWGTENQVIWEAAIKTNSAIATTLIWAGLKLTNTPTIATDDDQVFFRYDTDVPDTNWKCISSIGGTDTNADSGVAVTASTTYYFRIEIDSDRRATFYIDNVAVERTAALTNDVDFIPYIGVQALAAAARSVFIGYQKISRYIYE